jgi:hypothetical protein
MKEFYSHYCNYFSFVTLGKYIHFSGSLSVKGKLDQIILRLLLVLEFKHFNIYIHFAMCLLFAREKLYTGWHVHCMLHAAKALFPQLERASWKETVFHLPEYYVPLN